MSDRPFDHLIFCHPLKAVYAPVPKAACSSMKAYLRKLIGLHSEDTAEIHGRQRNGFSYAQSIDREQLIKILFTKQMGYFKFCLIRNPYARIVSAYEDLVASPPGGSPRGGALVDALRSAHCMAFDKRPSEIETFSFETFVEALGIMNPNQFDRHWQLQVVLTCSNFINFDMVIKLEDLAGQTSELAHRLGTTRGFDLHLNRARPDDRDLRPFFTPGLQGIIQRIYARDFARYKYDPDLIPAS